MKRAALLIRLMLVVASQGGAVEMSTKAMHLVDHAPAAQRTEVALQTENADLQRQIDQLRAEITALRLPAQAERTVLASAD
jgi:peptidoglycan hydrolase CwlO-like protein